MSNWSPLWDVVPLKDIAEFRNGINFGSSSKGRGIKVIGVGDFQDYVDVRYDELDEINPEGVVRPEDLLRENDFVFVRSNGNRALIGRSLFVRNLQEKVTHSGFTIRLRFTTDRMLPEFFVQLIRSNLARDEISHFGSGTNISNLSQEILGGLVVPLPPLPEQRAIAAILSTWDEAISLTTRLIEALKRRKQALMKLLLTGEVRFAEFDGEWEEVEIGDVAQLTAGGTPSTRIAEYWGGDIRWMSSGEVHQKRVYEVEGRITEDGLNNSSTKILPTNSVLVALAGQGKTRGTVAVNKVELATNQSIAAIIPDPRRLHYGFLFYNLDARYEELRRLSAGDGGRGGLNLQILKTIAIAQPPIEEQLSISDALEACDTEIVHFERYMELLTTQKRGLMQQLLTGAVRVHVEEGQ